jgi:predicted PurR-regulated permease PerM
MPSSYQNRAVKFAAILVIIYLLIYGLYILQDVLIPVIFASLLAFLLLPLVSFLEAKRWPRVLSIVTTLLIAFLLITLAFYLIIVQIRSFDEIVPVIVAKFEEWLKLGQVFLNDRFAMGQTEILTEGRKYLTDIVQNSSKIISGTLSVTTTFLTNFSLIPLYVFLMLLYRDFLQNFLFKAFRNVKNEKIRNVLTRTKAVVQNYMSGLILVILIVGTLNTVCLLLLGIDNALFFGFFAAFLVLIPYIGVAIGSLLPIIMALITKDSAWYAFGVAASFGVIQFLEGNFITPYIVGSKVSINSLVAIIALILFGTLWGVTGLILALPMTAILKVLFDSIEFLQPWGYLFGDSDHEVLAQESAGTATSEDHNIE